MRTRRCLYAALACCALEMLCLQAQVLPYTPSRGSRCLDPKEEYYEESVHKCCRLCGPGFRVLQKCNETHNTQCADCKEGSYKEGWNRARLCFSCSPQCKKGFVEERPCTPTQNRVCWCPPGHFCSSAVSEKCYHCQPYQKCEIGHGVVQEGTRETDVECAPCQPGTFSDHESDRKVCTRHRICQPVLVPGNSSHDTVCGNPGGRVNAGTTSPPLTTVTKRPPLRAGTERPTFNDQDPSADTGKIVGMTAIPLVLLVLIGFVAFRKSGQKCLPMWEKKKQPFLPAEKFPGKWPQVPEAVGQEKYSLLQTSPSGLWDGPAGSEKSQESSNGDPHRVKTDSVEQESLPLNDGPCCSTVDSRISGNGKAHVNVSCVVSICNGGGHRAPSPALSPSGAAHPRPRPDLPLSQEETAARRGSGQQIAVEVDDSMDFFDPRGGKPLPLGVQDAGMKSS
ncbi:tumor necrosis factor receptor superfamily member 1B-like [Crotalus tigris]|uniref:tumor necrosis factor receptor superfamily member 1B-like n=1 Tax=Crotalus tigris TaxID=88082 RepID=UPI00192F9220|nr:tumor necrosis factor receptor superfamily member 1B-like [Crotalus tigris]